MKNNNRNRKSNGKGSNSFNPKRTRNGAGDTKGTRANYSSHKEMEACNVDAPATNDPNWWNRSATFDDSSNIPFNVIPGYTYSRNSVLPAYIWNTSVSGVVGDETSSTYEALPGLMTVRYYPIPGPADNWTDPVNRSWMSIYSAYASRTTGTIPFQPADLAIIGEAANSIVTLIFEVKRALGLSNLYSNLNQYLPKSLLESCLIDPDTVIGHQDTIRRELNYLIGAFNALNLPGYTDLWKRRAQLAANVYADEDDVRAVYYSYVTEGYYEYTDTADNISDAEHLTWYNFHTGNPTLPQLRSITAYLTAIDDQINAIKNSAAFPMISAAVLRAFGTNQVLHIDLMSPDFIIVPHTDRMMTYQTQNADFIGKISDPHVTCDVTRNCLICEPSISSGNALDYGNAILTAGEDSKWLNSFDGVTDKDFIIEATRLKVYSFATQDPAWSPGKALPITACGTEICSRFHIWKMYRTNESSEPELTYKTFTSWNKVLGEDIVGVAAFVDSINDLTKVNNHPYVNYVLEVDKATHSGEVSFAPVGDFYRYTMVDYQALGALHTTALQSIYTLNPGIDVKDKG